MRAYIISLMGASFLASLVCGIFPGEEGKWVRLAAGLFVACTLLKPAFSTWEVPEISFDAEKLSVQGGSYLADSFEENLAQEIEAYMKKTCHQEVSVVVFAQMNDAGEITGVNSVGISPYTKELAECVAKFLEIDTGKVVEE